MTTYETDELRHHFEVHDFLHPYAIVTRLCDRVRGTLRWDEKTGRFFHFERLHGVAVTRDELTPKVGQ